MSDQATKQSRPAEVEAIQAEINKLFVATRVPLLKGHEPKSFCEFDPDDNERMDTFLHKLATVGKDDVTKAAKLAQAEIASGESPLLVKLAMSIFLTHSKQVHRLKISAPSLKDFLKAVPLSNPTSPETLHGYGILSYWREDYDLNDHHYHWHIVYPYSGHPTDPKHPADSLRFSTIDRQGELFLYMHSQMLARYNAELLSWGLYPVAAFQYDDVLIDGYVPPPGLVYHDKTTNEDTRFIPRPANRGWNEPTKARMITWRDNIFSAIHDGHFVTKKVDTSGKKIGKGEVALTSKTAMNLVGMVVEAQHNRIQVGKDEFIERDLYGSLHNLGHDNFAKIGHKKGGNYGVMGYTITAVRDPVFWIWHRHIDEFRRMVVKKYTHSVDEFKPDAELDMVKIVPEESPQDEDSSGYTHIKSFLEPPKLDLQEVNAKLNHEKYLWKIGVNSTKQPAPTEDKPQEVTIRLFIVPKGQQEDQNAWIEMDKFTHKLTAKSTPITRHDYESTVARKVDGKTWCKCGWPQNMMLPVGKTEGMPFIAFAMLTKHPLSEDTVTDAISFCGAELAFETGKSAKYPDCLDMGYPFNKTWSELVPKSDPPPSPPPSIMSIVKSRKHMLTSKFKIYRTLKNAEEC